MGGSGSLSTQILLLLRSQHQSKRFFIKKRRRKEWEKFLGRIEWKGGGGGGGGGKGGLKIPSFFSSSDISGRRKIPPFWGEFGVCVCVCVCGAVRESGEKKKSFMLWEDFLSPLSLLWFTGRSQWREGGKKRKIRQRISSLSHEAPFWGPLP